MQLIQQITKGTERIYNNKKRQIEIETECHACATCNCEKYDKNQFDIRNAEELICNIKFEKGDQTKDWVLNNLNTPIFENSKTFNFIDFTNKFAKEMSRQNMDPFREIEMGEKEPGIPLCLTDLTNMTDQKKSNESITEKRYFHLNKYFIFLTNQS